MKRSVVSAMVAVFALYAAQAFGASMISGKEVAHLARLREAREANCLGANIITFVDGEYTGLTNKNYETSQVFSAGQVIDQSICILKTADSLNDDHDGTELMMEIRRGGRILLRDSAVLSGGAACFSVKADDILDADSRGGCTRSAIVNARSIDGCEMAVFDGSRSIVDITMPFSIMAKSTITPDGGSGGSCVTGGTCFMLVAMYGLVSLNRTIRESRFHSR